MITHFLSRSHQKHFNAINSSQTYDHEPVTSPGRKNHTNTPQMNFEKPLCYIRLRKHAVVQQINHELLKHVCVVEHAFSKLHKITQFIWFPLDVCQL